MYFYSDFHQPRSDKICKWDIPKYFYPNYLGNKYASKWIWEFLFIHVYMVHYIGHL